MQIFATHKCPVESAKSLDDRRRNKMIVETVQCMVYTMYRLGLENLPYKKPSTSILNNWAVKWTADSQENYYWMYRHAEWLLQDYTERTDKIHKTEETFTKCRLVSNEYGEPTGFVNHAYRKDLGIDFSEELDVHHAYRKYLEARWELEFNRGDKLTWGGIR